MEENKSLSPNYELVKRLYSKEYGTRMFDTTMPQGKMFKRIVGSYYYDSDTNAVLKKCKLIYNRYACKSTGTSYQKPHWSVRLSCGKTSSNWLKGGKLHTAWLNNDEVLLSNYVWTGQSLYSIIKPFRDGDDPYYKLTVDGKVKVRKLSSWLADAH